MILLSLVRSAVRSFRSVCALGAVVCILQGAVFAAPDAAPRSFDIPAAAADVALKRFSEQSGHGLLAPTDELQGIRTKSVKGEYTAREALDLMLADSGLLISQDPKTGAFSIRRSGLSEKKSADAVVTGKVSNKVTGDFLGLATVAIEGTSILGVTERSGDFRLSIPSGKRVLVVSYTGLDTLRIPLDVPANGAVVQNVELTSAVYTMERMEVTGIREGASKAIQNQRTAMNSKSVVSLDTYGNPGSGVGELLQRLPGVAVDIGSNGEPASIYIRGMNQGFSSMMLDGNSLAVTDGQTVAGQYVYLGQVNTSTLESLEIIKAPLPETDGNAISGYVNLRTKRAFDRAPQRRVTLALGTRYTDLRVDSSVPGEDKFKLDLISLDYSDVLSVFGGKNNLGVVATVNFNAAGVYTHEAGPNLATLNSNSTFVVRPSVNSAPLEPLVRGWSAGHWNTNDENSYVKTFSLNVDYKLNRDTVFYAKTTASNSSTDHGAIPSYFRWRLLAPNNTANFLAGSTYDLVNTTATSTVELESVLYIRESEAYTFTGGVERKLFDRTATWTLEGHYNKNIATYPAINEVKARLSNVGFQLDRRGQDAWFPTITQTAGLDWSNPANYQIVPSQPNGTRVIAFNTPSERKHFRSDFEKQFLGRIPFSVKAGVKYSEHGVRSLRSYKYYTYVGPTAQGITPYVGATMKMGTNGKYGPFPFPQVPTTGLSGDIWNTPSNFAQTPVQVWQSMVDSLGSRSEVGEEIAAGYVQGQVKFENLRILGGVRVEETRPSGASYRREIISSGPNDNRANAALTAEQNAARAIANWPEWIRTNSKYRNVFPGVHVVYDFKSGLQARASYNVSITRPGGGSLLPSITVNEDSRTVSAGNPDLKPYTADNFEAAVQYYFEPVGMLSAGVFLKEISNYFRSFSSVVGGGQDNGFGGNYEGYALSQQRNTGGARVRGIEFSYQQQFTFLPRPLSGLGAYANFTYLETYGDFGTLVATTKLPNLTPRSFNAGVSYRAPKFELRLLGNFRGKTYQQTLTATGTGTGGITGNFVFDSYTADRFLLDFKSVYNFNRTYSFYLDVYNLTNAWSFERVFDQFGREHKFQAQGNGMVVHAGFKARF